MSRKRSVGRSYSELSPDEIKKNRIFLEIIIVDLPERSNRNFLQEVEF